MKAIKWMGYIMVAILSSCVERYYPGDTDPYTGLLAVNAHLTDKPGRQKVSLSRSDRLMYPEFKPEPGAAVQVENELGEMVRFNESGQGEYVADIRPEFLQKGLNYRLLLVTADGNRYESDFTTLHSATAIDSVYCRRETFPDAEGTVADGIRFYMDFEIDLERTRYLRWELIETYEYHNPDYDGFIFDVDRVLRPLPDSMSDRQCWITLHVPEIYTLETKNLSADHYSMKPLHFVSNQTQRLKYGYSLLVRQLSMDEVAFRYWEDLKMNTQESGALFDRQPSITRGNICNCDDPDEKVLGYFSISGVHEKKIFVKDVEGLEIPDRIFCFPDFEYPRYWYLGNDDLPVFMSEAVWPETGVTYFGYTPQGCLDCRLHRGSSGDPPDFWPE
jgi:hypothetical protein